MKPLPDLDNVEAMAAQGRRSALMSAWNRAKEALRDAATASQSADITEAGIASQDAMEAAQRLIDVQNLWRIVNDGDRSK